MPSEFGYYESRYAKTIDTREMVRTAPGGARIGKAKSINALTRSIPVPRTADGHKRSVKNDDVKLV